MEQSADDKDRALIATSPRGPLLTIPAASPLLQYIGKQFCSYISQNVGGGVFGRSWMMCTREQDQWLHGGSGRQGPADDRVHTKTSTHYGGCRPHQGANTASHCGPSSAHLHIFTVNFSSLSQSRWEPLGSRLGWQCWWKNRERVA